MNIIPILCDVITDISKELSYRRSYFVPNEIEESFNES